MNRVVDRIADQIEDDIADRAKDRIVGREAEPDETKTKLGWSFGSVMREFSIGEAERIYIMVYTRLVDDHMRPKRKSWWQRLRVTLYRACLGRRVRRRHFERSEDVENGYRDSGELMETCAEILNGMEKGTSVGWPLYDIAAEYIEAHPLSGYSKEMQTRVYSIALQARGVGEFAADYGEHVYEKAATWGDMDIVPEMVQMGMRDYLLGSIYRFNDNKEYKEKGSSKTAYEVRDRDESG